VPSCDSQFACGSPVACPSLPTNGSSTAIAATSTDDVILFKLSL